MCNIHLTTSAPEVTTASNFTHQKFCILLIFGRFSTFGKKKGKKPFKINWVFFFNCRMSNIQILTTWTGKRTSPLARTLLDYRLWSTKSKQKEWDLSSSWSVWNIAFNFQSGITKWRIYSTWVLSVRVKVFFIVGSSHFWEWNQLSCLLQRCGQWCLHKTAWYQWNFIFQGTVQGRVFQPVCCWCSVWIQCGLSIWNILCPIRSGHFFPMSKSTSHCLMKHK